MQNLFKTAAEDNIRSIRSYVTELKERVAKLQYQKQLLVCQVLELEASGNEENEEEGDDRNNDELVFEPVRSPSSWKPQFEQQRSLIFELWDSCNVSIIHRTQFFLLFKGDLADSIYMEVELRRLTWLNENFKGEAPSIPHSENSIEEELIPASPIRSNSAKSLKREKELLARQLSRRLTKEEREDLFMTWGVPLDAKQRKLQLINRLWTDPHNLEHIEASAEIVARIVGILNPGSAPKEMFALNFAPPNHAERPGMFGWNGLSALLNF
jgi:centromeric protein E